MTPSTLSFFVVLAIGLSINTAWCLSVQPVPKNADRNNQSRTVDKATHRRAPVTIWRWPRSQWDVHAHEHQAARVVITRAIRICQRLDSDRNCAESKKAWTTALARDQPWEGYVKESRRKHHLRNPYLHELYHTYDNLTYTEVRLVPINEFQRLDLENTDRNLVELARQVAASTRRKGVFRWDAGWVWPIPMAHWNPGERALYSGDNLNVDTIIQTSQVDSHRHHDDASNLPPLYLPKHLRVPPPPFSDGNLDKDSYKTRHEVTDRPPVTSDQPSPVFRDFASTQELQQQEQQQQEQEQQQQQQQPSQTQGLFHRAPRD